MLNKLAKLIDVKSLMTLTLTAVFAYLSVTNKITATQFIAIYTTIVGFYFGTQYEKNKNDSLNRNGED